ncbi:HNH endonuclease [Acidipila sp. EB88]|uniref:HNH endonuclease n=1 Tax=Acidipila sp. EB88 TaxID=2305226 RepID=UPI000F5E8B37|nr:HNH endonuclease [Acidipila sp. EB88]RRA49170.1 HNH endonuclease [Acidipila sp. EB88]
MPGGRVKPRLLPQGANGRTLCRWCSLEVPSRRRTFCSDDCVHQWRLRSSPAYLRAAVLERDKGICARCTVDTLAAYRLIKRARGTRQQELLATWGLRGLERKSLWDADHVLPVAEGGGECDLSNLRTLCVHCHRVVTAALRLRLAEARAAVRRVSRSVAQEPKCAEETTGDGV